VSPGISDQVPAISVIVAREESQATFPGAGHVAMVGIGVGPGGSIPSRGTLKKLPNVFIIKNARKATSSPINE